MGALHDLYEVARDYGLGMKYFALSLGIVAAMMLALYLWGSLDVTQPPEAPPAAAPTATSY